MGHRQRRIIGSVCGAAALAASLALAEPGPDPFATSSGSWGQQGLDQWALPAIGWEDAGEGSLTVAVLDSGIDWLHPDLPLDRLWRNPSEVQNGVDDDGNGFVDDRIGWDFVHGGPEPWDHVGHGTHVAGVIAAATGNGVGIAGLSRARILPLKVLGATGRGRASHVVAALDYAVAQGARVINLSLGGDGLTQVEREAIRRAAGSALVVLAVGNHSRATGDLGLRDVAGVLVVSALGRDGRRAPFSNFGPDVRIAAPGVDILSLRARATDFLRAPGAQGLSEASFVGDAYQRASGTSFAAAIVSGAAARLLAERPELTPAQLARVLEQSAQDVEPVGVDQLTGFGAIDLAAARSADPAFFVDAAIERIELAPGGQLYRVIGRADADRFGAASLSIEPLGLPDATDADARGDDDTEVTPQPRRLPVDGPVTGGILLRLDRGALADASEWQLTLTVEHESGRSRSAGLVFAARSDEAGDPATTPAGAMPAAATGVSLAAAAGADVAQTTWSLDFPLELPSGVHRILTIPELSSPAAWARARGLPEHSVHRTPDGGGIASLPGTQASGECAEGACPVDACRTHRTGLAFEGTTLSELTVRLVPEAPRLSAALEPAPELLAGAVSPGALGCEPVPFDLAVPGTSVSPGPGAFTASAPDAAGDPGCWELVADPGCAPTRMPARELAPEFEPGRILALVPKRAASAGAALAALAGLSLLDAQPLGSIDRVLLRFATTEGGADAEQAVASLSLDDRVDVAQRERRYHTVGMYSDPLGPLSYGPAQIGAERLHAAATGVGIRIAVIDSGVDAEHPELAGRIVGSHDTTGYGASPDRHGTAVAGLIAAQPDNGAGAWGAAPGSEIVAVKACQPVRPSELDARCWSSTIARALDVSLESDVQVINMSIAGPRDPVVERLIEAAAAKGVLVVAASGNGGPNARPSYPAALESVLAVTAVDADSRLYGAATRGAFVDVAAPGVEVVSPAPGGAYPVLSGTSFATAFVSGAAALLLELQTDAGVEGVRSALEGTTADLGEPGPDPLFGAGRVDLCAAASLLRGGEPVCP